jgi:transposase InsO family protein
MFRSRKQALAAVDEAVILFNNTKRPHLAFNYETPEKTRRRAA